MGDSKQDSKQKFSHETELDSEGLIGVLESLLAGIRSGELSLEHGQQSVRLRPGGAIAAKIEAKHKPGRESLRLELEWQPEVVEPVLRIGPVPDPAPIEARRRGVVALREARRSEAAPELAPELAEGLPDFAAVELGVEALVCLPKERLYALAQAVDLDGRSQLHKTALARALSELDLRAHLRPEDLRVLAENS